MNVLIWATMAVIITMTGLLIDTARCGFGYRCLACCLLCKRDNL